MTDTELKNLVASLAIESAKTDERFRVLREEQAIRDKKLDEQFRKTDEEFKKIAEQFKKTDEKFKQLGLNIDGIARTQGEITEDYFFDILKKDKRVANLQFDEIAKNSYKYVRNDMKGEYDIILFNGDSVMIVEIKNKVRDKDIENLKNKQIKNFRELFPTYKDYKVYGAIAGFTINDKLVKKAKNNGFFVLKKKGEIMVEEHKEIKVD
jgi:hypothetical protein